MKTILLIGEYSRLHNSLKEGLHALDFQVTLVGNGDGFKQYPVDFSIEARFCKKKMDSLLPSNFVKNNWFRFTKN